MVSHKVIQEVREECECEEAEYCPLEAMLSSVKDRVAEQHKLVEFAKFNWNKLEEREMTWNEAYTRWIELGYAEHFAQVYSPNKTYREMRWEMFRQ